MRFFVDNNLSEHLANGMAAFHEDVVHLKSYFREDENDEVWLADIGTKGWILITRDERVRHRPVELEALKNHDVGAFFLGGKNRSRCELIQQLVRHWPRLKELATRTRRPFAYRVPPSGTKIVKIPL